jgi:hypothetical protein
MVARAQQQSALEIGWLHGQSPDSMRAPALQVAADQVIE